MLRPRRLALVWCAFALTVAFAACFGGDDGGSDESLLLTRQDGIFERALKDGREELLIANPPESVLLEPAISPDGSRIAYVRQLTPFVRPDQPVEIGMDLHVANRDGSDARLVLEHAPGSEMIRSPAWLPGSDELLVSVERFEGGQVRSAIERVDLATGTWTVLIDGAFQPSLAADGSRIAYLRIDEELNQSLWVANADGSDERQLAGPEDGLVSFSSPRFSPDGRVLAFGAGEPVVQRVSRAGSVAGLAAERVASYNGFPEDIWTVDLESGERRLLADLTLDDPSLGWSADGSRLYAYAGLGLFDIDPATGTARQIAEGTFHGFMAVAGGG